jgi:AcrR family transcriptional regulator
MPPGSRRTAGARRAEITTAATVLFAHHGYARTTTDAVARAAGVSQPYVIRLFGGKRDLFLSVIDAAFDDIGELVGRAPRGTPLQDRGDALRGTLGALDARPDLVLVVMQAVAAATDDERIRARLQEHIRAAHKAVWAAAGGDTDRVREFFGQLALLGTVAAIDVPELLGPEW